MGHVTRFSKDSEGEDRKNHFELVPENRTAVDNILRVNHGNQMRLGLMADAKANIMITVTSIVFSVTVANLDNEVMKWPLLTFAFGCFWSRVACTDGSWGEMVGLQRVADHASGVCVCVRVCARTRVHP